MSDATTLVVTATPNPAQMDAVKTYLEGVLPLLMGAGGKPVKRLKVDQVVKGEHKGMVLVMDFESRDAVAGLFESEAYRALIPARDRGFAAMDILLSRAM